MTTVENLPHPAPAAAAGRPADAEPALRGGRLLHWCDRGLSAVDRLAGAALPAAWNPLLHLGAIANWCFLIAAVTGFLLLLWYVPSVHEAHASMRAMEQAPWTAGLVRSLHRYSSDACMLLALLHALKMFCAGRFSGSRWLAWITGGVSLLALWLCGWLGYWLVWDQPARHVAEGTARALDVIPIFVEPLERSFLTDASVNSLLFFLVFFAHMLLPLLMVIGLWLHITRLARARFLPRRPLAIWCTVVLVGLSLLLPATAEEPARMAEMAQEFRLDAWYLAPVWLTDRLSGGALWLFWFVSGVVLLTIPWTLVRGRIRPASVAIDRCNACQKCFQDCPYLAISMVPRTDGKDHPAQAQVDPSLCVGCGICAGSCDTAGIGLDWLPQRDERARIEALLAQAPAPPPGLLLGCAHGATTGLRADAAGRSPALPGWLVLEVPCAGWVHMVTAEQALKRGAREVVIASCGEGNCRYREGAEWAEQRRTGARKPFLRQDHVDATKVRTLALPPGADVARALAGRPRRSLPRALAGAVLLLALLAAIPLGSFLPYRTPLPDTPELVVSLKHPGQLLEQRRPLTDAEKAALPPHMRRDFDLVRERLPVRLWIRIDGNQVLQRTLAPHGLWGDGNAIALERLPVPPGEHDVEIRIGDGKDPQQWQFTDRRSLVFEPARRRVVLFERHEGFRWH